MEGRNERMNEMRACRLVVGGVNGTCVKYKTRNGVCEVERESLVD
jgi:hypothetical protein